MKNTFNKRTVQQLPGDTSSMQLNRAVEFCKEWLAGQQEFVFHTSGSTGSPKKIILQRKQLEASANATIRFLNLTQNEHILICLNTHLIAGTMMLVRGLMLGCEMTIVEPSTSVISDLKNDHPYTFVSLVPFQLKHIDNAKLEKFRNVLVGGAPLHAELEEKLKGTGTTIWHTYGMTETVSHIALRRVGKENVFTALPGIELKTDDRECLCIRGDVTNNDWVNTNDMAELIDTTHFIITGRLDHVINTGGMKVQPERVEIALQHAILNAGYPQLEGFITSVPDVLRGEKIVAVLQTEKTDPEMTEMIRQNIAGMLNNYEIPKEWLGIKSFILTPSGKIDKSATLAEALNM